MFFDLSFILAALYFLTILFREIYLLYISKISDFSTIFYIFKTKNKVIAFILQILLFDIVIIVVKNLNISKMICFYYDKILDILD